jgi:TonB family protein
VPDEARRILSALKKNPDTIIGANDLDQPLKPLSRRPPAYPTKFLSTGKTGEALIEFFVDRRGDAQLPHIISSTEPEFGYAAAQAVATWRFEAPLKSGKPATVRVRIPVEFELPSG